MFPHHLRPCSALQRPHPRTAVAGGLSAAVAVAVGDPHTLEPAVAAAAAAIGVGETEWARTLVEGLLGEGSSAGLGERHIVAAGAGEDRFGVVGRLGGWKGVEEDKSFQRQEEERTVAGIGLEEDTAASLAEEDNIRPGAAGFPD